MRQHLRAVCKKDLHTMSPDSTTHCIYRIVCFPTGKSYIGRTSNLKRRMQKHFSCLRNNDHVNKRLQNAWNKYKESAFYFEILEGDIPTVYVDEREVFWVAHFNSYKEGFNGTSGGGYKDAISTPCTWNGIAYPSIKAAAKAVGVIPETVSQRLRKGLRNDDDLSKNKEVHPSQRSVIWNGTQYPSMRAAADAIGVIRRTMSERLRKGFTCDSDTHLKRKRGSQKPVTWNNIQYPSINAASRARGVRKATMKRWLKNGYCRDIDIPPHGSALPSCKPVTWNGVNYPSVAAAARACGIAKCSMQERLNNGYTRDSDMRIVSSLCKVTVWNGIEYPSVSAAARANGINKSTMQERVDKGYTSDKDLKSTRNNRPGV